MQSKFSNSVQLMKESWNVLMADKELVFFPIISGLATMLILACFSIPFFIIPELYNHFSSFIGNYTIYVGSFLFYLVVYCVSNFFNAALVSAVYTRLNGGNPTVVDGLKQARQHFGEIVVWSLVAATVGTILRILSDRASILGKITALFAGVAWSLVTYFIVPVLVFEDLNTFDSIKRSGSLFKQTWGENVISQVSFGLLFALFAILGICLPLMLMMLGFKFVFISGLIFLIVYWTLLRVISSTLIAIFNTVLYIYATTGQVPAAFSRDLVTQAFVPKTGWLK